MTYQIEKLCKVYSSTHGDQLVWRKTRPSGKENPYEWSTRREAESFLGLFFDVDPTTVRVVEVTEEPVS